MNVIKQPLLVAAFFLGGATLAFGQNYQSLIKNYFQTQKSTDFKKSDLTNLEIENIDASKSLNADVVKFQQLYNGLPVVGSVGTALVKDGKITYLVDDFVKNYSYASSNSASRSIENAVGDVSQEIGKPEISKFKVIGFSDPSDSNEVIKQRKVYFNDKGSLKLAYELHFQEPKSANYWLIVVDAQNAKILDKQNLNFSCDFTPHAYSSDFSNGGKLIGPLFMPATSSLIAADNASYNVFPLPIEAPTFGGRSVVNNPWLAGTSPDGWHNDGTTSYTITRGNNVHAYEDTGATSTPGFSPDGGATRNFNFPYDTHGTPATNQAAAITNLFYMNNKMHDILYKFGFTESARNFQNTNYGLGGLGNDYVLAEAQDGGGTNNANFSSPPDGSKGRMQMYIWSSVNSLFFYNAPSSAVTRNPDAYTAAFGPALTATGVTGDVKLSSVLDGCSALPANSMTNKIGLVERGNCNYTVKVKNVQNAGGVAAIVYNAATSSAPGNMGGSDATITIPSVLITNSEGEYIKNFLASNTTVNVTLKNDPDTAVVPDGDFDNGIIAHEYGHGVSNRLTGTGSGCLNTNLDYEQMGEGWSDFMALMLTNQPGATAAVPRGIGTYAMGEATDGVGIRPRKYSPDFAINDYTYGKTNTMVSSGSPIVHSIGFVWATMLWDLHWNYVEKYGYASDIAANPNTGSGKVFQMVVNGMKLQPCLPTFVDGRNAILAADQAATGGADKCMIWKTFAKRGLGVNASAGSKTNITDQVEDFTVPAECTLATNEVHSTKEISVYPNPAKNEFFISANAKVLGNAKVEIYDMTGKLVSSYDRVSLQDKTTFSTTNLTNGIYVVKVKGMGVETSTKLIVSK